MAILRKQVILNTRLWTSKKQLIKNELCKFTSEYFKNDVKKDLALELNLDIEQILLQIKTKTIWCSCMHHATAT